MKRYVLVAVLGACCAVLDVTGARISAGSQAQVQQAVASVDVVVGEPRLIVHLTNNASRALEAWQLQIDYLLASGSPSTLNVTTDTCFSSAPPGASSGAILSRETRDETFATSGIPLSASVTVRMSLFEDLSFEGSAGEASLVRTYRERHARTLGTWIDALQAVAGKTDAEAKAILRDVLASERIRADPSDSRAAFTLERIAALVETNRLAPTFSDHATALRQRFERQVAKRCASPAR